MTRITMLIGAIVFTVSLARAQQRSLPVSNSHNNSGQTVTSGSGSLCSIPKAKGNTCLKGTPPAGSHPSSAGTNGVSGIPYNNSALGRILAPALGKTTRIRGLQILSILQPSTRQSGSTGSATKTRNRTSGEWPVHSSDLTN